MTRSGAAALRVVVDTNVWVSGAVNPDGPPGQVIRFLIEDAFEPVLSWPLVEEILDVFARPQIAALVHDPQVLTALTRALRELTPEVHIDVVVRDADDLPVVACAVAGNADLIVTGDKDLLEDDGLTTWLAEHHIEVLRPADFVERIET